MRFDITHTTRYNYEKTVSSCINLAHVLPRNTPSQTCISSQLLINPLPVTTTEHCDYFGNRSCHFSIEQDHQVLEVTARSQVDIQPNSDWSGLDFGNTCQQVRERLQQTFDRETLLAREFALESPLIMLNQQLSDYAAPLFSDTRPFLSAVRELNQKINTDFIYDPDFSDVSTPLMEVFEHRRGVCQDFAHLAIGCLRALGYPARYVSGYLETQPPVGQAKLQGSDESHAWFAVYSPGEGWFELDPTNNMAANENHIVTAWGRDYSDVAPIRGVIFGGGESHELQVSVDVIRLA